jgi:HEPN domain-containing protein
MIDAEKQVSYWRTGAQEDWEVAQELIDKGRTRHGLFFAHLALEKILKAHVCRKTQELAPRLHNLTRLVELASVDLQPDQKDVLAAMNAFNIEGRYPELLPPPPTASEAQTYITHTQEVFQCLMNLL